MRAKNCKCLYDGWHNRTDMCMKACDTDLKQFATSGGCCKDVQSMTRYFKKLSAGLRGAKCNPVCAHTSTHLRDEGSSEGK